jgi:hypothetical protein
METGNSKLENRSRGLFSLFPGFPVSFTPSLNHSITMSRSPNHSMARWLNSPFPPIPLPPFPFSPFPLSYRFALSPFSLVTCLSAAGPLPPRLPGRGRPPPPGDCTPWPLGRRGRSSCRGTLRSSAPLSTAGRQERSSDSGLVNFGFCILNLPFRQSSD